MDPTGHAEPSGPEPEVSERPMAIAWSCSDSNGGEGFNHLRYIWHLSSLAYSYVIAFYLATILVLYLASTLIYSDILSVYI